MYRKRASISRRTAHWVSIAALSATALPIIAQEEAGGGLEEVIVTAQKRSESLQDTPIAITALTGDALESFARDDLSAISSSTPALAYSEAGGEAQIFLRGVGSNLFTVGADPSVAMQLDGVYLGRANMGLTQFLDVDRVEVLRGPQGTLYGRSTSSRACRVTKWKATARSASAVSTVAN
jgi:iron complex outermembrane receptor protein